MLWDRLNMSRTVLVIYVALVIYGSLYPFSGWNWARGGLRVLLTSFSLKHAPRADLVINVAIYIPVGLLIIRAWPVRAGTAVRIATAAKPGFCFSARQP